MSGCAGGGATHAGPDVNGTGAGIESGQFASAQQPNRLVRITTTVDSSPTFARPGSDLVLVHEPAEPIPPRAIWIPRLDTPPTLADGTTLRSLTFALVPREAAPQPGVAGWLGSSFTYDVVSMGDIADDASGSLERLARGSAVVWITLAELPASVDFIGERIALPHDRVDTPGLSDGVLGFTVTFGPNTLPVRFLPQGTWSGVVPASMVGRPFGSGLSEVDAAQRRAVLAESLYRAATDPLRRWRLELLADARPDLELSRLPLASLDDPRLVRVSRTTAGRWRLAINRLAQTSGGLAGSVTAKLTAVSELPSGAWLPMWPPPSGEDQRMLVTLLDPGSTQAEREEAARRWLNGVPGFVGVVLDDASPGGAGAAIAVTDVGGQLESIQTRSIAFMPARLKAQDAFRSAQATVRALPRGDDPDPLAALRDEPEPRTAAEVALLGESGVWGLAAAADPIPVRRPGLVVGPLLEDWTRDTLYTAAPTSIPRDRASMVVVRKRADGAWVVHVEVGHDAAGGPRDSVTVHADGIQSTVTRSQGVPTPDGGWVATVELPDAATRDGVVSLAVTRQGAAGVRSSWPRPMLPLQANPGRIALDLTAWDRVGPDAE